MTIAIATPTLFELGAILVTTNAQDTLNPEAIAQGITRHANGDWGELPEEDIATNQLALEHGSRLFSAYGEGDQRFWIITEADRSVTTILLPQDY